MTGSHICLGANDCMGSQNLGESLATMTLKNFISYHRRGGGGGGGGGKDIIGG